MYVTAQITDPGIVMKETQDSIATHVANVKGFGLVTMAAVCDGMNGLVDGDVASSIMVKRLTEWFTTTLYYLIVENSDLSFETRLYTSINRVCKEVRLEIRKNLREKIRTGEKENLKSGTTLALLILFRQRAYVVNIGDSRVYLIRNNIHQLTKDQTVTQLKLDRNEITEAEALIDHDRSTLWQCVGSGPTPIPECQTLMCLPGDIYILCSDGFRHKVSQDEIFDVITKDGEYTEEALSDKLGFLLEENKKRMEKDNISAIVVRNAPEA